MKWFAILSLIVVVFGVSVVLTALGALSNVSREDGALLNFLDLQRGHITTLFTTPFVWSKYPRLPQLGCLFDLKAFLLVVPLLLVVVYLLRVRSRRRFPILVGTCLAVMVVPLSAGAIALHENNVPEIAGPWLVVMLLGPFYVMTGCALLCVAELCHRPS
jgi:hypothetical protein